jgi:hypothetical protein
VRISPFQKINPEEQQKQGHYKTALRKAYRVRKIKTAFTGPDVSENHIPDGDKIKRITKRLRARLTVREKPDSCL